MKPTLIPLTRWRRALMCKELYDEIVATRDYIDELEQKLNLMKQKLEIQKIGSPTHDNYTQ